MKHSGVIVTIIIAVIAFSVQWGVTTATLGQVEKRLDEFILEARTLRVEHADLKERVSFMEGQIGIKEPKK